MANNVLEKNLMIPIIVKVIIINYLMVELMNP